MRGSARASRIAASESALSVRPSLREVRRYSNSIQAAGSHSSKRTQDRSKFMTLFSTASSFSTSARWRLQLAGERRGYVRRAASRPAVPGRLRSQATATDREARRHLAGRAEHLYAPWTV